MNQGGAEGLAGQADSGWDLPLGAVVLGVRHMGLSGYEAPECAALENELTAWQQQGDFKATATALRQVNVQFVCTLIAKRAFPCLYCLLWQAQCSIYYISSSNTSMAF